MNFLRKLVVSSGSSFRIHTAAQERVIYNKEVQTTAIEEHSAQDYEEEIRQRILREREAEAEKLAQERELEEESVKLDQEIEQEIRGEYCPSLPYGALEV